MTKRKNPMILAILFILATSISASAQTTIKMMDVYGHESISDIQCADKQWGDFAVDISIGEGAKKPQYNGSGDVRLMYYNTITIKSGTPMTEISFNISSQGLKQYAEIFTSTGSIVSQGANPLVWKGNATEITFTVGRSPKYSNSSIPNTSLGGQLCFLSVDITAEGGAGVVDVLGSYDDSDAKYFDLQGVSIENPRKGTPVIRLQNGKATKVVF